MVRLVTSLQTEKSLLPCAEHEGATSAQLSLETWALVGAQPQRVLRGARMRVRQN